MKLSRLKIISALFLFLISTITAPIFFSPAAQAASRAEEYCDKKYQGAEKSACIKGFSAGYDKKKDAVCDQEKGDNKTACSDGFENGTKKRNSEVRNDGKKGVEDRKSKRDTCRQYNSNASEKKMCEKAWDSQVKTMAKAAGEAGQSSPCNGVFGGGDTKQACDKAFDQGVAAAKRKKDKEGINTCGGVATFFQFDCSGTDKNEGGKKNPIIGLGLSILGWITAIVAVAVVGGIVYGGFLYMTAQDNSGQTQKGITVIVNSILALILWVFAYVVINFLVPGGLFN